MVLAVIFIVCAASAGFAARSAIHGLKEAPGTPEMLALYGALRSDADSAAVRRYTAMGVVCLTFATLIYVTLAYFSTRGYVLALQTAVSFLAGILTSSLSGFIVSRMAFISSFKAASAAVTSVSKALASALSGGAAGAVAVFAINLSGMGALFFLMNGISEPQAVPLRMAGFCLGAALASLIAQIDGCAFVCLTQERADKSGIARSEDEQARGDAAAWASRVDDARRLGMDLFASAGAESSAAMILCALLWPVYGMNGVLFALAARAAGLAASIAGFMAAKVPEGAKPMSGINRGYAAATAAALAGLGLASLVLLNGNMWLFMSCVIGVVSSCLLVFIAYYYNEARYRPVNGIIESSRLSRFDAVLNCFFMAMGSLAAPGVVIAAALLGSYYCGVRGLEIYLGQGGLNAMTCGFCGVAAAAAGMFAAETYIFAVGSLGAITGGASELSRISRQSDNVRINLDALKILGDTVRPLAGGYARGAAVFAGVLLFAAYMESVKSLTGLSFDSVNIARIEVLLGAFLGAVLVFVYGALALKASVKGSDGFPAGSSISAVLKNMAVPVLLALGAPVILDLAFKRFGPGFEVPAAFALACAICCAAAGFISETGASAWRNAVKFMERPASACDRTADLLGYASGLTLNSLMKLEAAVILALAPLFI